jgi:cobalt-precorrin 5A hydrolase
MAVIGIGTTSRATVADVLAVIEAAQAKMAEMETRKPPSTPFPLPRKLALASLLFLKQSYPRADKTGEKGVPRCYPLLSRERVAAKRPGEGGFFMTQLVALDRPALNGTVGEAAREAGLQLTLLTLHELRAAAHLCVTHSEKSMKRYGIPSVAEAAALAAAGAGARLLVPRFCGRNTTASVAIAA